MSPVGSSIVRPPFVRRYFAYSGLGQSAISTEVLGSVEGTGSAAVLRQRRARVVGDAAVHDLVGRVRLIRSELEHGAVAAEQRLAIDAGHPEQRVAVVAAGLRG